MPGHNVGAKAPWWVHCVLIATAAAISMVLVVAFVGRPESVETLFAVVAFIEAVAVLVNALANLVLRIRS